VFHLQGVIVRLITQMGITADLDIIRPRYVPVGDGGSGLHPEAGHPRHLHLSQRRGFGLRTLGYGRRYADRLGAAAAVIGEVGR
jgi:hypothetical protein